MYSGPHISKSGLIFAYDTGEFPSTNPNFDKFRPHSRKGQKPGRGLSRFYRGRPSINYVAHQNAVAQVVLVYQLKTKLHKEDFL